MHRVLAMRPLVTLLAAAAAALAASTDAAAQAPAPRTLVFDLSPFTPDGVSGELIGLSTAAGQVIHARLDATYLSNDAGPWSLSAAFFGFPGAGVLGVSSDTQGWAGAGTFTAAIESDALNGTLGIPDSDSFWTWFMAWSGGKPFTLPGGGEGLGPVDGQFTTLKLTLFLAPCPHGDPHLSWTDAGDALPGTLGAPVLTASGSLCGGEPTTISLANARPLALTALVAGFTALDAPFKGGVLVPKPDVLLAGLPVSAAGTNLLAFAWPAAVPSGFHFWLQHWIVDPQGPQGFAASNALAAVTP